MNDPLDDGPADTRASDPEFTLGTPLIFVLFFVLVIVCALCFGLGYSMGHRSPPPAAAVTQEAPSDPSTFSSFKPAPGSPAGSSPSIVPKPAATAPASTTASPTPAPAPIVRAPDTSHSAPATAPATPIITGEFVVQVAAISLAHQDDATSLVRVLRSHGYSVNAFPEPDKLIHIQAGPFATRAAAEAVRARLATDGYQPLIKQQ